MADMRMMTEGDPRVRACGDARHALTAALVKPGRGFSGDQAKNSFNAMSYTRFAIGDEVLYPQASPENSAIRPIQPAA
jgi:hypothetical protein